MFAFEPGGLSTVNLDVLMLRRLPLSALPFVCSIVYLTGINSAFFTKKALGIDRGM